jgi:hypothetical protein
MIIPASSCTPLGNDVISEKLLRTYVLLKFDEECHRSVCVATDSVPAELRVHSWDQAAVLKRLSKEGGRKHGEGKLTGAVVPSLFIKH